MPDDLTPDAAPPAEPSMSDAASAMDARLEAGLAGVETDAEGNVLGDAPAPPSPSAEPSAPEAGDQGGDDDSMTYGKAKELRQEQKEYRERWGRFEQAYGDLDEGAQNLALQVTPVMFQAPADAAADLAFVVNAYPSLHPDDRAVIDELAGALSANPQAAVQDFQMIAATLRGDEPDGGGDEEPDLEPDGGEQAEYVTREALDEHLTDFMSRAQQRFEMERREQEAVDEIRREVTDLGYDLESDDPMKQAQVESLFALARRLGGDIAEAHKALQGVGQAGIDEFVGTKAADATRPQPPGAAAPASEGQTLDSLEDGAAAMEARLDAALGR